MEWNEAFSLFIDGLPVEMTRDWLLQIFRGEGEVIDVYVSQKRRHNNNCRFGFVRFKKLKDARNAIRNLNGAMCRGQNLKVSFAKYDKNGRLRNDFALQETGKASKPVWRKHRKGKYGEMSFKEVVAGLPLLLKVEDQALKNHIRVEDSDDTKEILELDKLNIKGMVWKVVEEVFKSSNIEELKRKIGDLM